MMHRSFVLLGLLCLGLAWAATPGGTCPDLMPYSLQSYTPEPVPNASEISFANGIRFDTRTGDPVLPADLRAAEPAVGETGYYIVQFDGPVYRADQAAVEAAGALVAGYVPNYAYLVRLPAERLADVRALTGVRWVGPYQPAYKIDRELAEFAGERTVIVRFFMAENFDQLTAAIGSAGGRILETANNERAKLVKVAATRDVIRAIARIPGVNSLTPWRPNVPLNSEAQWVTQTATRDVRKVWDKGLKGEGQIISTSDTGIKTGHVAFRDNAVPITDFGDYPTHRKLIAYAKINYAAPAENVFGDDASMSYHGTHTGGTTCGDDAPAGGTSSNDGMALKCRSYFVDIGGKLSGNPTLLVPMEIGVLYSLPYNGNAGGAARIMSNSWGSQSGTGPIYDDQCVGTDDYVWNHPDFLPFISAGNTDRGPYVGSPSTSKNVVCVGATYNGASSGMLASFSSVGPCSDGRFKPDILAPGVLTSANGGSENGYISMMGTSMSSPCAASAAILVRQFFCDGWYGRGEKTAAYAFTPSAALIKACVIASADNDISGHTLPDGACGWGRIDVDSVIYFKDDAKKLRVSDNRTGLATGDVAVYRVDVTDGSPLRVALVWTDPAPASAQTSPQLVNNLNLELVAPNSTVYKGNVYEAGESKSGGNADNVNNVECCRVNFPAVGTWTIRVLGGNIPKGPQPYALVVTGGIEPVDLSYKGFAIDDAGQSDPNGRLDPGETATLKVSIQNTTAATATNVRAILRTKSTVVTVSDSTADYGTVAPGLPVQGSGFTVSASPTATAGTVVKFAVEVSAYREGATTPYYSAQYNFQTAVGRQRFDYADHDINQLILTVTKQGSIGFLTTGNPPEGGSGIKFPKSGTNYLYMATFAATNGRDYVVDRAFGSYDWKTVTSPDGRLWIGDTTVSDQDSWAMFDDAAHLAKKKLTVEQLGFAYLDPPNDQAVILQYKLRNNGTAAINNLFVGILADFDMGSDASKNLGGTDLANRYVYMRADADTFPCIGIEILYPKAYQNLSLLNNPTYVYSVWADTTLYNFLAGDISQKSTDTASDWSMVASMPALNLAPGAVDSVAFAIIGGTGPGDLKRVAQKTQAKYDTMFILPPPPPPPGVDEGRGGIVFRPLAGQPNPFTTEARISFGLAEARPVDLAVYDASGAVVRTLVRATLPAGEHNYTWNGRDGAGRRLAAGIYFVRLKTTGYEKVVKTVMVH